MEEVGASAWFYHLFIREFSRCARFIDNRSRLSNYRAATVFAAAILRISPDPGKQTLVYELVRTTDYIII